MDYLERDVTVSARLDPDLKQGCEASQVHVAGMHGAAHEIRNILKSTFGMLFLKMDF